MIHNGIIHNGGGKRNGSFAMYLEPWHADIFEFLELKKNHGNELERARDLFYALWIPDLFMQRVKDNEKWSLFCPNECPGLHKVHSQEFNNQYSLVLTPNISNQWWSQYNNYGQEPSEIYFNYETSYKNKKLNLNLKFFASKTLRKCFG